MLNQSSTSEEVVLIGKGPVLNSKQRRRCNRKKKMIELKELRYKFKTQMCKHWAESSQCVYGDQCIFAHGKADLHKDGSLGLCNSTRGRSYANLLSSLALASLLISSEMNERLISSSHDHRLEVFKMLSSDNKH